MGSQQASEIAYPHSTRIVFQSLINAIPKIQGMKISQHDVASCTMTISVGISWKSWGESIALKVVDVADDKCVVKLLSASDMALIDWGKNRDNIDKITSALHQELKNTKTVESPASSATPPAGLNFCSHCGAKLVPSAKFCPGCGQKLQ
jgi:hypothetical protein